MTIQIKRSPTADSRTCDVTKVTKDELLAASIQHIEDVQAGLHLLCQKLEEAAALHDYDKRADIDWFYSDFQNRFILGSTGWWDNHRQIHRHHLDHEDGVPEDVNLLDVMEHIVDCVMAGKARAGEIYPLKYNAELMQRAFENTVKLMDAAVQVVD